MRLSNRRSLAAVTAMLGLVLVALPARADQHVLEYRELDGSVTSMNVLPPGQGQHVNTIDLALWAATGAQPDHNTDQLDLYESMVAAAPSIATDEDVAALYKDASFGVAPEDVGRTYSPRADITVIRDLSFNVPHVFGATRAGTMFGAGYVSGEDRLFMMDVLRHTARGRLSELLGASDANLAMDRGIRKVADYTEEELWSMLVRAREIDPVLGQLAQQDILNFTAGVNAYIQEALTNPTLLPGEYPALQLLPEPWQPTDSVALAALIGGEFSQGGGGQLDNARFLSALEAEHDPATARAIFDDFRNADDPEAPVSTSTEFSFNDDLGPVDPAAVARPDDEATLAEAMAAAVAPAVVDGPWGPMRLDLSGPHSNALLVSADVSETGRPIAVMGPQVAYYSPEILMEIDLHGPGVHARGATFPGISLYVLLGRGVDYAWSATTAFADHIDIRAVELCEPDGSEPTLESIHYLADGVCAEMYTRTDSWLAKPTAGGIPEEPSPDRILVEMSTERTHHGIVQARGTVDGEPVAFVRQRSSYFKEVDATLSFLVLHDPARMQNIDDLLHAFGDYFSFSFNWHVLNGTDMGWITTGLYPVLADGVDPDLPYWGDSQWDPVRFLSYDELPKTVNNTADGGFITNWNNKQAPGFRAPDNGYAFGSVQRKQLLTDGVLRGLEDDGKVSIPELVQAMGIAATQDLRGMKALPLILQAIGDPGDERLGAAVDLLSSWVDGGAHRRDADGDGTYEDAAAVALMDAMWSPTLEEMFKPVLGTAFDLVPTPHVGAPGPGGSSFWDGWMGYVSKDLRTILGESVEGPYSRTYCGDGDLAACRDALLAGLSRALDALEEAYGADPAGWDAQEERDLIRFTAVGVVEQRAMHWQNRPTFQQVVEFEAAQD